MSTHGSFNTKNPTIRRILKEANELASQPSPDYAASPLDDNLFEWHFTLRGPPAPSPYADGLYHGRIILPSQYPLRPPSFRFTTPSGRFEVNREICLSISGFHEETWQPAWGIRTALVAIRSFMDTGAAGQVGGLECSADARRKMAGESRSFRCGVCGRTNAEIIKEKEEEAAETDGQRKEETVPEELRLAYRDELGQGKENGETKKESKGKDKAANSPEADTTQAQEQSVPPVPHASSQTIPATAPAAQPLPSRTVQLPAQRNSSDDREGVPAWVDYAIYGVFAALLAMIFRNVIF